MDLPEVCEGAAMTKRKAMSLARQMERYLIRCWEIGDALAAEAEEGCPVAQAALEAIEDEGLPAPITDVPLVVRSALENLDAAPG